MKMKEAVSSETSYLGGDDDIVDGLDEAEYPHLFEFVRNANRPGSKQSECKTAIDILRISPPSHHPDLRIDDLPLPPPPSASSPAGQSGPIFIVVEGVSPPAISRLKALIDPEALPSFLRFLDDFLDDSPSYNYLSDIEKHLPAFSSTCRHEHHVKFLFNQYRELQYPVEDSLTYTAAQIAIEESYWRCRANYGLMNPLQRSDRYGLKTRFPPIAVSRRHCAAWFDTARAGAVPGSWSVGIVLVDPPVDAGTRLGAPLTDSLSFKILFGRRRPTISGRNVPRTAEEPLSHRKSISLIAQDIAVKRTIDGSTGHLTPLHLMDSVYRVLAAEWMVVHTYCVRDINTVEWRLQGERGDGIATPKEFEQVHKALFWMRQRLKRYLDLTQAQQNLCASGGRMPWFTSEEGSSRRQANSETEMEMDYMQVVAHLKDDFTRVQQVIEYINSLSGIQQGRLGLEEAGRSSEQNRLVLVLTVVATFFLPISTTATILSMEGDWAPGEANFGRFLAISVPLSVGLVGIMMAFMFSSQIGHGLQRRLPTAGGRDADAREAGVQGDVTDSQQVILASLRRRPRGSRWPDRVV